MQYTRIHGARTQVSHKGSLAGDRDARLEQLSWRVWGMKRKKAMLAEQNAVALAELSKHAALPVEDDAQSAGGGWPRQELWGAALLEARCRLCV